MFESPDEWAHARRVISVFKFTQQHTFARPDQITGPNTLHALGAAGAFRMLARWGIKIALGSWSVKEFYCTPDASGMARAVGDTLDAVAAVRAQGGIVHYLAMDEPFLSGQSATCGGPALEPTADRLATYFAGVKRMHPYVEIGLIEAYPSFGVGAFASMLQLMADRGISPAFLHLDVDLRAVPPGHHDLTADVKQLQALCRARRIPFGLILWGYNGDADALFADDAHRLAMALKQAYPEAGAMPDQLIVESWSPSSTGRLITPSNLPEDRRYSLTNLLTQLLRRFRAAASSTVGSAIPR
ncbi:MAG: hypothetical protein ACRD15_15125 [Vicinamibacterales bacterium]